MLLLLLGCNLRSCMNLSILMSQIFDLQKDGISKSLQSNATEVSNKLTEKPI